MIKIFLFFIAFIAFIESSSQTVLKIYSLSEGNSLPYANVANLTQNKIYSANSSGDLSLVCHTGDILSISFVGYLTKKIVVEGSAVQKIGMEAARKVLPTVKIYSCTKFRQVRISNSQPVKKPDFESGEIFGGFEIGDSTLSGRGKIAFLLQSEYKNVTLSNFSFFTKQRFFATSKLARFTPIIISFYEVEDSSGKPGELLSNEPLFCFPKKYGKQTIELEKLKMQIPQKGIYIGIQFVVSQESKSEVRYKTESGEDSVEISYGGMLEGVSGTPTKSFSYFDVKNDAWYSPFLSRGKIKYEATLKICND